MDGSAFAPDYSPTTANEHPGDQAPKTALCPRCGYDLRGEVATWRRSCPLVGRCIECGMDLRWAEVFSHAGHPWLFEAEWRFRPLQRIASTITHAFTPRRFWSQVRLTGPIRLAPPILVLLAIILVFLTVTVVTETLAVYDFVNVWGSLVEFTWWDAVLMAGPRAPTRVFEQGPGAMVMLVGMPLAFLVIPTTLREARVRPVHVLRIWLYSLVVPILIGLAYMTMQLVGWRMRISFIERELSPWWWAQQIPFGKGVLLHVLRMSGPSLALAVGLSAWFGFWWHAACRSYLALRTTRRIVLTLLLMVWIASLVAEGWVRYAPPEWLVEFLSY
ncbi:MAG: hypothetical protein GY715_16385 [Planctomycetes bacterium]|nr:hypothetical protein [Planctomycetota bacterium]